MTLTEKKKNCMTLAVIGGGASGLFAAIQAALYAGKNGIPLQVTVFEAEPRVGKKLLSTGNGRCNLSNLQMSEIFYRGNIALIRSVLSSFSGEKTISFFWKNGLFTRADTAGRVYPACNQATGVLDFLRAECDRFQIRIVTQTPVTALERKKGGFLLNHAFFADKIIYSCGSPAGQTKADPSMQLLRELHVSVIPFSPALCPLKIEGFTKSLKGVRAQGCVRLFENEKMIAEDCGEIQYTEYGLSGIPVMQLSAAAADGLSRRKKMTMTIDSVPDLTDNMLWQSILSLIHRNGKISLQLLLGGFMHKRLGDYYIRSLGLRPEQPADSISEECVRQLVDLMKCKTYTIEKTLGFAYAQAAAGGVPASEVDILTLELKKMKGFYVCGEALDVVGQCGGYNLQWAWSSGYVAGIHAVKG